MIIRTLLFLAVLIALLFNPVFPPGFSSCEQRWNGADQVVSADYQRLMLGNCRDEQVIGNALVVGLVLFGIYQWKSDRRS
jgi:hypothetical protein